jgi:two-component system, LytTR family, sensor kinase
MKITGKALRKFLKHLAFLIAFWVFLSGRDMLFHNSFWDNLLVNLISLFWFSLAVLINIYELIPRFLTKKQYGIYILSLIAILAICIWANAQSLAYFYAHIVDRPKPAQFFSSIGGYLVLFSEITLIMAITMAYELLVQNHEKDQYFKELEKRNLESELSSLKSQINPHFLFNSLNSIYFLIKPDNTEARNTLVRFSDILKHQLYMINNDRIGLETEIESLKNYVALEEMRQSDSLELQWKATGDFAGKEIAPMLLLPFVENAFKHGRNTATGQYWINIDIAAENGALIFNCENYAENTPPANGVQDKNRGLGLENVRRRLDLIYPNKYELTIAQPDHVFKVHLKVKLDENTSHYSGR